MSKAEKVKVWGLPIRVFHWSLVAFFAIAYITGEELETLHAWSGYVVIALIVFRLIWGLVGGRYARFSNFIYSPKNVRAYLKSLLSSKPLQYLGHNPAAGVMVLLLLVSLALTSWSGLQAYAAEGYGPLATTDMTIISSAYADDDHGHENENENGDHDGKPGNGEDFAVMFIETDGGDGPVGGAGAGQQPHNQGDAGAVDVVNAGKIEDDFLRG